VNTRIDTAEPLIERFTISRHFSSPGHGHQGMNDEKLLQTLPLIMIGKKLFRPLLLALSLLMLSGCMSLDSMNQFTAEWDQKHAPGTGITGSRLAQVVTILATYEATLRQRQIAEQRAREAHARMVREQQAYAARQRAAAAKKKSQVAQTSRRSSGSSSSSTKKSSSKPKPKPGPESVASTPPPPKVPKRIAVEVPHSEKKGATTVMLWDTASERLVGNEVYDLSKKPAKGSDLALWQGASAQYVGTGG